MADVQNDGFSFGGAFDSFAKLAQGYMGMKTAEAAADATGAAQAQLSASGELPAGAGGAPLSTTQYQNVGVEAASGAPDGGMPFGLSKNHMMIGGGVLLAALLLLKR